MSVRPITFFDIQDGKFSASKYIGEKKIGELTSDVLPDFLSFMRGSTGASLSAEKDISFIKEKIIRKVKAELMIRISRGYQGINLNEIDKEVNEALKKTNVS